MFSLLLLYLTSRFDKIVLAENDISARKSLISDVFMIPIAKPREVKLLNK